MARAEESPISTAGRGSSDIEHAVAPGVGKRSVGALEQDDGAGDVGFELQFQARQVQQVFGFPYLPAEFGLCL